MRASRNDADSRTGPAPSDAVTVVGGTGTPLEPPGSVIVGAPAPDTATSSSNVTDTVTRSPRLASAAPAPALGANAPPGVTSATDTASEAGAGASPAGAYAAPTPAGAARALPARSASAEGIMTLYGSPASAGETVSRTVSGAASLMAAEATARAGTPADTGRTSQPDAGTVTASPKRTSTEPGPAKRADIADGGSRSISALGPGRTSACVAATATPSPARRASTMNAREPASSAASTTKECDHPLPAVPATGDIGVATEPASLPTVIDGAPAPDSTSTPNVADIVTRSPRLARWAPAPALSVNEAPAASATVTARASMSPGRAYTAGLESGAARALPARSATVPGIMTK